MLAWAERFGWWRYDISRFIVRLHCGMRRSHSVAGVVGVTCGKSGEEVVFTGLYGPFGGVATVSVGRYSLESDFVFAEG